MVGYLKKTTGIHSVVRHGEAVSWNVDAVEEETEAEEVSVRTSDIKEVLAM